MINAFARPRGWSGLVLMVGLLGTAQAGRAQTTFTWPDTAVNVATYTDLERCISAVQRVRFQEESREALTTWTDTLPYSPLEYLDPEPAAVTATARRCGDQIPESSVTIPQYQAGLQLFLAAGRDSDALALLARRLDVAAQGDASGRKQFLVLDTVGTFFDGARGARPRLWSTVMWQRLRRSKDLLVRIRLYGRLLANAVKYQDTVQTARLSQVFLAAADSITPAERKSKEFDDFFPPPYGLTPRLYLAVQDVVGERIKLDSLRSSTAAYVALEHDFWHKLLGQGALPFPYPAVGREAPPIVGKFWFDGDSTAPPPQMGRVSLLVFMSARACGKQPVVDVVLVFGRQCEANFAVLRRLAARFPRLRITIVAPTIGYFSYDLMPAAEEARWIDKWVRAHAPAGVAVVVDTTPYFRLPEPDGRRVNKPTDNVRNYTFGSPQIATALADGGQAYAFLVDQGRRIVNSDGLGTGGEPDLARLIEALFDRQTRAEPSSKP